MGILDTLPDKQPAEQPKRSLLDALPDKAEEAPRQAIAAGPKVDDQEARELFVETESGNSQQEQDAFNKGGQYVHFGPTGGDTRGIASPSDKKAAEGAKAFVKNDLPNIGSTFGARVGAQAQQSVGGMIQYLNESEDGEPVKSFYGEEHDRTANQAIAGYAQKGRDIAAEGRSIMAEVEKDAPMQTRAGKIVAGTVDSIGSNLPGMAATMLTGSPTLGLSMMGAQSFGQAYGDARSKGLDIADATTSAAIQGGAEVATEALPFVSLAKYLKTGNLSKEVLKQYLSDIPGEHIATAIQNATGAAFTSADQEGQRLEAAANYIISKQHVQDQIDTFFTTILQGAVMGGLAKVTRAGAEAVRSTGGGDPITGGVEIHTPNTPPLNPYRSPGRIERLQQIMAEDTPEAQAQRLAARQQPDIAAPPEFAPDAPVDYSQYGVEFDEAGVPIEPAPTPAPTPAEAAAPAPAGPAAGPLERAVEGVDQPALDAALEAEQAAAAQEVAAQEGEPINPILDVAQRGAEQVRFDKANARASESNSTVAKAAQAAFESGEMDIEEFEAVLDSVEKVDAHELDKANQFDEQAKARSKAIGAEGVEDGVAYSTAPHPWGEGSRLKRQGGEWYELVGSRDSGATSWAPLKADGRNGEAGRERLAEIHAKIAAGELYRVDDINAAYRDYPTTREYPNPPQITGHEAEIEAPKRKRPVTGGDGTTSPLVEETARAAQNGPPSVKAAYEKGLAEGKARPLGKAENPYPASKRAERNAWAAGHAIGRNSVDAAPEAPKKLNKAQEARKKFLEDRAKNYTLSEKERREAEKLGLDLKPNRPETFGVKGDKAKLPEEAREAAEKAGVDPDSLHIIATPEERKEYVRKYGVPNVIDEGNGVFGKYGGSLFVDDETGKPVAYAPEALQPPGGQPITQGGPASKSTAPEHANVGVTDKELSQIVQEFNQFREEMAEVENEVHHLFDPPKKAEIIRLQDKVKVYHNEHGWMSVEEAKKKIQEWKDNAEKQGETGANRDKVVLSLFDLTGSWSRPWEEAGYQVYRFDIQDDPHLGDVNNFSSDFFKEWFGDFENDIYAILAATPCTDFAVSGARHFAAKDADGRTISSVKLVHMTLATIEYFRPAIWAVENPVGRIEKLGGLPPWRLSFDPNHLGDPYTKKTLLWGRFNADLPIAPVDPVEGSKMHTKFGGKSLATKNARSATPEGFAYAFFQANNAVDNPVLAISNKFDRLDKGIIAKAVEAGMTDREISEIVEDLYYMENDDEAANKALKEATDKRTPPAGSPAPKTVKEKKRQKPRVNPAKDSILTAISKMGGMDIAAASAQWGQMVRDDLKAMNAHVRQETGRFGHVFHKGGIPLDDMRVRLSDLGYLPEDGSLADLEDAMTAAARGEVRGAVGRDLDAEIEAEAQAWAAQFEPTDEDLDAMSYQDFTEQEQAAFDLYYADLVDSMLAEVYSEGGALTEEEFTARAEEATKSLWEDLDARQDKGSTRRTATGEQEEGTGRGREDGQKETGADQGQGEIPSLDDFERMLDEAAGESKPATPAKPPRYEQTAAGDQGVLLTGSRGLGKGKNQKAKGQAGLEDMALFTEPKERKAEKDQGDLFGVAQPATMQDHIKAAVDAGAAAVNEILKGMTDPNKLGSGPAFDDEAYERIKPHLRTMWREIRAAGFSFKEAAQAFAKQLIETFGAAIKPFALKYYSELAEIERNGGDDVERSSGDMERDSGDAGTQDLMGQEDIQPRPRGDERRTHQDVQDASEEAFAPGRDPLLPRLETAPTGEQGDNGVHSGKAGAGTSRGSAGDQYGERGGDTRNDGPLAESVSAEAVERATDRGDQGSLHLDDVDRDLPELQPGQREDVRFAERRFSRLDGHGVLFTNGTGTGKTYTGLGIIKRFVLQGKDNGIIIAPNDNIINAWISTGKRLGLNIKRLEDTQDNGKSGVVVTTYANFGQNPELAKRSWDFFVADEAHNLSSNKDGNPSLASNMLNALALHPRGVHLRTDLLHPELKQKMEVAQAKIGEAEKEGRDTSRLKADLENLWQQFRAAVEKVKADVASRQTSRPKVVFLSATPFAYEKSIDYAEGYLFDYGPEVNDSRYNSGDARSRFFMQHFGYRMRYNKLTEPPPEVDRGIMQRQFNTWLKKQGVLSARVLDVASDYDRKFILVDSAVGNKIDDGLQLLRENPRYRPVYEAVMEKFDHLSRRYLLEAIKAKEAIPVIKEHRALGRQVVVFHDYNKGGGFNPFHVSHLLDNAGQFSYYPKDGGMKPVTASVAQVTGEFLAERPDLQKLPLDKLASPLVTLKAAFPDILIINGTEKKKDRQRAIERFQDDEDPAGIVLVQSAAGEAGISLHDTTGKAPRVLINLGLPTRPQTSIQQEGRTYRIGQASDAMFRYMNTGTSWERYAFATTIANRTSAAENLALGESARAMRDAFIEAFQESGSYPAGFEGEGKGGKERDRAANMALSEWDRAITLYFGQKKGRQNDLGADYFATPEPLGLKMVEWAEIRTGDSVLEPSLGHGAIGRWFPEDVKRRGIEPSLELASRAALVFEGDIVQGRFEDHNIVNKYDAIVMNPPFGSGGKTAIDHLAKASKHLKDHGRVVAIIPTGPAADKKFEKWLYEEEVTAIEPLSYMRGEPVYAGDTAKYTPAPAEMRRLGLTAPVDVVITKDMEAGGFYVKLKNGQQFAVPHTMLSDFRPTGKREKKQANDMHLRAVYNLPRVTFERAGTSVAARVVVLDKGQAGHRATRDFSEAESINEFFEALENWTVPERVRPAPEEEEAKSPAAGLLSGRGAKLPSAAPKVEAGGVTLAQFNHTKTGAPIYVATINKRLSDTEYKAALSVAKRHGGHYSSFKGAGAIPGFHFGSEDKRNAFAGEIQGAQEEVQFFLDQTETPEFKKWFGNSKVVSAEGKPLVVYHGSEKKFTKFKRGPTFFARDRSYAEELLNGKGAIVESYVTIEDPLEVTLDEVDFGDPAVEEEFIRQAKAEGRDGIIFTEEDGAFQSYVVFEPTQIKSATENSGGYDPSNPDIRFDIEGNGRLSPGAVKKVEQLIAQALPEGKVTLKIVGKIEVPAGSSTAQTAFSKHGVESGAIAGLHRKLTHITTKEVKSIIELSLERATEKTGYHEVMHAAEALGLISPKDLAILAREYPKKNGKASSERRADAFADYVAGRGQQAFPVKVIFAKVKAFLKRLGDLLRGKGWRTADDVFADLESGKLKAATYPSADGEPMRFSLAEGEPAKTVKAYKLFRTDPKKPGQLFPLFVNANQAVPVGKWVAAEVGPLTDKGKVKSKLGPLAYRPGWHAGDLPIATHIGQGGQPPTHRPSNQVWAEIEMPDDVDWQTEANRRGTNAAGKLVPVKAHITDQLPVGGHYRYKTNPNMTGNWLISGAMKINRVLSDAEVEQINGAAGVADLPRVEPLNLASLGFTEEVNFSLTDEGPFRSSDEEVQKRRDVAHGLQKGPGLLERIKATLERMNKERQHFPELDRVKDARTADILRVFEASRQAATAKAVAYLKTLTREMSADEMETFEWRVLLDDLMSEKEKGHKLPFGYDAETLEADHAEVVRLSDGNEKIRRALDYRQRVTGELVRELVAADLLPESVLENRTYFRHMVLEYANAKKFAGLGNKDLRNKKRGWQKGRQGSDLDINTNFLEAEFEVYSQQLKELATKEALEKVERLNDLGPQLKAKAKATNFSNLVGGPQIVARIRELEGEAAEIRAGEVDAGAKQILAQIGQELSELDPTRPYKQSMAIGFGKLERLARNGALPEGRVSGVAAALASGEPSEKLMNYISWLAGTDGEAAIPARQILKAIADLDKLYREVLGEAYLEHRRMIDRRLIPEGYTEWQPVEGNVFYRQTTMTEQIVDKAISATWSVEELVNSGLLKESIVMGGKKRALILPEGVAVTLDNLRLERDTAILDTVNKKLLGAWKIWTLLSPRRVVKYNLNNMSGDLDAAVAADPAILKYLGDAWAGALRRRKGTLTAEDKDLLDRGVIDSGISINEIPDISQLPLFKDLTDQQRKDKLWTAIKSGDLSALAPNVLVAKYFDKISGLTNIREALLREAAYHRALELLRAGKPVMWASKPYEINAIPELKDKAAKLARELIGDYGNISAHGERIRARYIPFWSWMEINAPRYYRIFKNAAANGGKYSAGARITGVAGKKVVGTAAGVVEKVILTQMLFALVSAFNFLMHGGEDDELDRKQLHLVLGKDTNGNILSLRFQGAFSDALSWFGLEDYPEIVKKMNDGSMDAWDLGRKMALATPNKIVNAALPFAKLGFETLVGKSFYPDITKPRPVRDRVEHVARFLSMENEYRAVAGKPSRGYLDSMKTVLLYSTDPGEQAYNGIRQRAMQWQEKHGKEITGGEPTARSNALYYYRQALRFGDKEAAEKYMQRYKALGGTPDGIETSVRRAAPLASLKVSERVKFRKSLSEAEKVMLERALDWYKEVYQASGR